MTVIAAPPPRLRDNIDFRRVLLAGVISKLGTQVSYLAVPLVAVTALSAGPGQVGLLGVAGTVAWLIVGLPAGAWVDRMRRRRVMIVTDLLRAVLYASIPVAWWLDALTLPQLYLAVFLAGVATVFFDVASQSLLPSVVGRESLTAANSMLVGTDAVLSVGGRSGAGGLVALIGAPAAVLVDAVGYIWSALFVARVETPDAAPARTERPSLLREVKAGIAFVAKNPVLRPIAISGTLNNVTASIVLTMLPIFFVAELGLPAWTLGVFLAVGGAGAGLGAALASRLVGRLGRRRTLTLVPLVCMPFLLFVPTLDGGWWLGVVAVAWFVNSAKYGVDNVVGVSYRQEVTPDALLGRMNATMRFLFTGALAVGAGLAGLIGEFASVPTAMWVGAIGATVSWLPVLAIPRATR
ncbi:MFS transporter [Phytomonospora endophytica]|uniref:MFS family permease n=1 Tax=Phytomonospora endophytica TaxID=714109 RepID=A0A841FRQ1_9ACTN|nr:MFS transporter [Phytomonospora endophytica]MBB6035987.1 MFS family permease [Phytomonospora endophytica]GIG66893.1 MFS transporter [Phytomonospora endophytica]